MGSYRSKFQRFFNDPRIAVPTLDLLAGLDMNPHLDRTRKFGYNESSTAGSWEAVWSYGGAYNWMSSAATIYLSSDTQLNTSIPVVIEGLDANWLYQTETITSHAADARNFIASTKQFRRVHRAWVGGGTAMTGGTFYISDDNTDAGADGIPDVTTSIRAVVSATDHQTQMAVYTVPALAMGYISKGQLAIHPDANPTNQRAAEFRLRWRYPDEPTVWRVADQISLHTHGTSAITVPLGDVFEGPVDMMVETNARTSDADVSATFWVYEFNME